MSVVEGIENDSARGRGALIKEFVVTQGQPSEFFVTLPAGTAGKFTLAWDDLAGSPAATDTVVDDQKKMLVNDLDITVKDVNSATTHYPWILNPDLNGKSSTLRSAAAVNTVVGGVIPKDDRNNVERVDIPSALGERTFKVTIAPQGTITGGSQKVSLILSGATPKAPTNISFASTGNPANANEMALTLATDPGAFFTVTSSTDLVTWADVPGSSFLATGTTSTVLVNKNPSESKLFWRLRRGQ